MKLAPWKIAAIVIASIIGLMILTVISYVLYVVIDYNRFDDNLTLDVVDNTSLQVQKDTEYDIATYNIGFGAYNQSYDFFMDSGYMDEEHGGKYIKGKRSKAFDKETVIKNTNGVINDLKNTKVDYDFLLFQEVDTNSHRSYKVNQYITLADAFGKTNNRGSVLCVNYHAPYFIYPLHEPIGQSNGGLVTFSRYKIENSLRKKYPITDDFWKYFDLDRCMSINRLKVNDTQDLLIINNHMSAYDEGGVIRAKQLELLNSILKEEKEKGNYVIVGGDFNHDISLDPRATSECLFKTQQAYPKWISVLNNDNLTDGYRFVTDKTIPTCRAAEMPYQKDVNFTCVIDGFIVSDNITVLENKNIDSDFMYSDHNPATMKFKLN